MGNWRYHLNNADLFGHTYGHISGYSWSAVQSGVAKFNRACWYDRAGYGWSDPAPTSRTFQAVAADLHQLLRAAAVPPPYVLVGGGDAASHIRVYHGLYPQEIAGVVMVNANDVDEVQRDVPESAKGGWARHFGSLAPKARAAGCVVLPVLFDVGLIRLAGMFQGPRRTPSFGLTSEQQAELDFLSDNPTAQRSHERCDWEVSMAQVRAAGSLGDVPLVVIASAGHSQTLARLSSRSRLVQPEGGVTADVVTKAITDVVEAAENH